eukprot:scpid77411/ scgid0089/ N-acetyltransferase ESCO1; CTF7 homolog 1; Establishment factor-like protein 1; Establishment of cohesion 1 homolog 1
MTANAPLSLLFVLLIRHHTFTSSPKSAPTPKRRRGKFKIDEKQLFLNFGQKNIGHTTCKECGMTYSPGLEETQHRVYHDNADKLAFVGWKSEAVLSTYDNGRCIMVLPSAPARQWKKAEAVISVVDEELGFCEEVPISPLSKVLLYISNRKVIGCLVAQPVEKACPLLPPTPDDSDLNLEISDSSYAAETSFLDSSASYCNKVGGEAAPVVCGVSRIWVTSDFRRKGIATRMLDCLRKNFFSGFSNQVVEKQQVAFTTPTESGQAFAKSYMHGESVLVYS